MQAVPAQAFPYYNNGGLYTYNNVPVAFPVAYNHGNLDVPDLTYAASSPESIASPRTPDVVAPSLPLQQTSKKPRSRRPKDPNHVGRPANSFMIFRSEQNAVVQDAGNVDKINQQEISRRAALMWRNLSREQKQPYVDAAAEQSRIQREYRESHPDSKPSRKRGSTSIKRARAQKPYERPQNQTMERVNANNNDVVLSSVPGPSPEQYLALQPSQFIDPMLTQCIPTNVVDQTGYAALNPDPQFDLRFDSTYCQLMPPSMGTTTQLLPAFQPAEQDLSALDQFQFNSQMLSNEIASMPSTSVLNDETYSQQLLDQFHWEASQLS